jgi:DinB family protein
MSAPSNEEIRAMRLRVLEGGDSIEAEAERHPLAEVASMLRSTRTRLQALIEGWSQEQLAFQPTVAEGAREEDRWSATEAVTHLVATQNWYLLHMTRLLGRREHFDLMPHGLGDLARRDVAKQELVAGLRQATERLLGEIEAIPAEADLAARRDSTFFGELSLRGWVLLAVFHDVDHTAQIERLTSLAGFPR